MRFLFSLLYLLTFNTYAVDLCSIEFLGMRPSVSSAQYKRMEKVARLENLSNKLRSSKIHPHIAEVDRYYIQKIIALDEQLYKGSTFLTKKNWRPIFRKVELHFNLLKRYQLLLRNLRLYEHMPFEEFLINLKSTQDDLLLKEIINTVETNRISSFPKLEKYLVKKMKKSGRILGANYDEYRIYTTRLDAILKNKLCKKKCRDNIIKLKNELGVVSHEEQKLFPILSGLKKPSLEEINAMVYSIPHSYETLLIKESLMELAATVSDLFAIRGVRNRLARLLNGVIPRNRLTSFFLDKFLIDAHAIRNHFPLINQVVKTEGSAEAKLVKLKRHNNLVDYDELLTTFVRRTDDAAVTTWDEIFKYVEANDQNFHTRMKRAQENARYRRPLTTNLKTHETRNFFLVLSALGIYQGAKLYLNFSEEETSLEDVGDRIDEVNQEEETDVIEIEIKDPSQVDKLVDDINQVGEILLKARD